jgi:uncharacterized membrane protein YhaH (DUF805 family)
MNAQQVRRAMIAGVVFVGLFVAGVLVTFANSPEIKSTDTAASAAQKWLGEISDSGHRAGLIVGAYLLIIAAIAFVWFCSGLREWLGSSAGVGRAISSLGVLGAGAITVAAITGGAGIAGSITFGKDPVPQSGDAIRVVAEFFFPFLFVVFGLVSAALIATIATSAMRDRALPRWLAYLAWIGVLGALGGVVFIPFVLPLLWYLAVAIAGFACSGARGGAQPPQPPAPSP